MTTREPYRGQRIGNMRDRVKLQRVELVDDGFGMSETLVDVATVWARVEPLKGQERLVAGSVTQTHNLNVHIRHRADVEADWRVVWKGTTYAITARRNLDERGRFLTLDVAGTPA